MLVATIRSGLIPVQSLENADLSEAARSAAA
jgi:hypothetical protein